jgi:hypothetical protein
MRHGDPVSIFIICIFIGKFREMCRNKCAFIFDIFVHLKSIPKKNLGLWLAYHASRGVMNRKIRLLNAR